MLTNRVDEYAGYPGLKPGQAWPSVAKPSPLFVFGGFRERERFQKSALFKHEAYRLLSVWIEENCRPFHRGFHVFFPCVFLCVSFLAGVSALCAGSRLLSGVGGGRVTGSEVEV